MKRIITLVFLLTSLFLQAKDFEPKDTWAYLFEDFTEGMVMTRKGEVLMQARLNVSVVDGKLHFLKDGKIMEADMLQVLTAQIGKDEFMNVSGKMLRVLSKSEVSAVLESIEVDLDKLSKAEIGYGITSGTASTQNLNMAALSGLVEYQSNMSYSLASERKGSGESLPIRHITYLFTRGKLVVAKKREVVKIPSLDKKAAEAFFKQQGIKWSQVEDLQKVADYIAQNA